MKKMKKIFAALLTLAMVLGMSMTTFAAGTPTANDKKTATVNNVEAGATVTAYQIVKANYDDTNGFTGYEAVDGVTIADSKAPTSDEVTAIATDIQNGDVTLTSVTMTEGTAVDGLAPYTADLNAGYWVVLVTGTDIVEVYNPMLVGVYYSVSGSDNTMASGPVDANSNWNLVTKDAYAKSTKPVIEKTVGANQNDVAIGDDVNFTITTAIPSYSKQYTSVKVVISDTLSEGLTLDIGSIEITVGGETYTPGAALEATTSGFTLTFPSDYALSNGGKSVEITYTAELNENAGINFDANTNTATLEYSNNPSDANDTETTDDKTYTYTFGIDALLYGDSEVYNQTTNEIIKVDEDGNVISTVEEISETPVEGITEVLTGATFTLTNNDTKKVYTATTDKDGKLNFEGLDAGTYTLVETAAPSGFTLDTTEHEVVISAEYDTNGLLESYTITIDGEATSTYTATYEGETITNISSEVTTTKIKNTALGELPSTGGIGTTIFTIGGCIIMIAAAGLFFASRRKENK